MPRRLTQPSVFVEAQSSDVRMITGDAPATTLFVGMARKRVAAPDSRSRHRPVRADLPLRHHKWGGQPGTAVLSEGWPRPSRRGLQA